MEQVRTAGVPPVGPWQVATVIGVHQETTNAKTFRLDVGGPHEFVAGQHFIVRLTAPDGYAAQRAYSAASAPGHEPFELTVELLPGGEVSGFMHESLTDGDTIEIRGPIGGHFAWDVSSPIVGVGGGGGVVPLMSMMRAARAAGREELMRLVVSARSPADLYYADELVGPHTTVVYSRASPPGHPRPVGRLREDDLAPLVRSGQVAFVCGTPAFCDATTMLLDGLGFPAADIRVERFGPSG